MFENLIDRLESSFKILKGEGKITEINVAETLKDVRKALLDADVSYKIAKTFCDDVTENTHPWQRSEYCTGRRPFAGPVPWSWHR